MKVRCTESDLADGTIGGCTACGELQFGVEPDARKYKCELCGKPSVYGLEELLITEELEITGLGDEDDDDPAEHDDDPDLTGEGEESPE